jgi:hypothetical protein
MRKFQLFVLLSNFLYQLPKIGHMFQDEDIGKKMNQTLNWSLWLIIFIVEVHSLTRKTLQLIQFG